MRFLIDAQAFTQILYDLAAYPSYVPALREEIESVIEKEGLTKPAIGKMRKLDSFIKESQRIGGAGAGGYQYIPSEPRLIDVQCP
jgi:hypothetical protein